MPLGLMIPTIPLMQPSQLLTTKPSTANVNAPNGSVTTGTTTNGTGNLLMSSWPPLQSPICPGSPTCQIADIQQPLTRMQWCMVHNPSVIYWVSDAKWHTLQYVDGSKDQCKPQTHLWETVDGITSESLLHHTVSLGNQQQNGGMPMAGIPNLNHTTYKCLSYEWTSLSPTPSYPIFLVDSFNKAVPPFRVNLNDLYIQPSHCTPSLPHLTQAWSRAGGLEG
ncbi:hypothetical protein BDN67DRAFT_985524 [Paxillus ammoniavirescens]|nr:hypothetical protein BDN67DRAFT_985524 [Paxillus ammoniavirescens]